MAERLFLVLVQVLQNFLHTQVDLAICSLPQFMAALEKADSFFRQEMSVSVCSRLVSVVPPRRGVDTLNDYRVVVKLPDGMIVLINLDFVTPTDEPYFLE